MRRDLQRVHGTLKQRVKRMEVVRSFMIIINLIIYQFLIYSDD